MLKQNKMEEKIYRKEAHFVLPTCLIIQQQAPPWIKLILLQQSLIACSSSSRRVHCQFFVLVCLLIVTND